VVLLLSGSSCQGKLAAAQLGDVGRSSPPSGSALGALQTSCGDGSLTEAGRRSVARAPYLQRVTDRSARVLFSVDARSEPVVDLSTPGGRLLASVPTRADGSEDSVGASARQRVAHLEGLEPGTTYCYALRGLSRRAGFVAAAAPGAATATRFVAFGDSGDGSAAQRAVRDQLLEVPFELILHTGDVAYKSGTLDELEEHHFGIYARLLAFVPFFPAAGNHDYRTDDGAPFRQVFALPENGGPQGLERWYSFDWGDVHFVALDTEQIGATQAEWLEADLRATDRPWKIVYLHKPPFSSGRHGPNKKLRRLFVPIFEQHGVQLVLAGHDHHYERTRPIGGVTYVITGGGGKSTRSVDPGELTAHAQEVYHFVHGEVRGVALHLRAIDATGRVFDAVRIPVAPSP
jgi:3',5'-cyclic AMP phosphodiesterase CpdA